MAWTQPRTWVSNEILTAALLNAQLRDNFNELDVAKVAQQGDYIVATGANALTTRQYGADRVDTAETTTSVSYVDLATVGPTVTLTTGTSALVLWAGQMSSDTADAQQLMSYAVSGATVSAAVDQRSICVDGIPANNGIRIAQSDLITGLTAGSNTFTCKYRSDGAATATFNARWMMVFPL